jgi:hypothetical protein
MHQPGVGPVNPAAQHHDVGPLPHHRVQQVAIDIRAADVEHLVREPLQQPFHVERIGTIEEPFRVDDMQVHTRLAAQGPPAGRHVTGDLGPAEHNPDRANRNTHGLRIVVMRKDP